MRPGAGRDPVLLELHHQRVATLVEPLDVLQIRLLRSEEADVRLIGVTQTLWLARRREPGDVAEQGVVRPRAADPLVDDPLRTVHLD